MPAPNDMQELRTAWRALAGGREGEGWKTIPVGTRARCMILAGRHLPGDEEAVLIGFRSIPAIPAAHLPQGHGFEVSWLQTDPAGGDRVWVALARRAGGSLELFALMVEDLIRLLEAATTSEEHALVQRALARIRAWQDFMDRHREGVLSSEAELGLFGELVLVEEMIAAGMPAWNVMDVWQGPRDGLQDFMPGTGGIEVKTTLSSGAFPVTVSSLDQLDSSLRQPLFLAAVRLRLDVVGLTLPAMADEIRQQLQDIPLALEMFEVRLVQAGLLAAAADSYVRGFLHLSTAVLAVDGDFPRLTRANVHPAIRRARYDIDLALASGEDIGLPRALALLEAI